MAEYEFRLTGAAGEAMESATLVEWLKKPGDIVAKDEAIVVVETAKATTELTAPIAGRVLRHVAVPGREIALHDVIGVLDVVLADIPRDEVAAPATRPEPARAAAPALVAATPREASGWILASPIARRLARENGLDLAAIPGTGPGGRVGERDVLAAVAARTSKPAAASGYRGAMARRMAQSAQIPQFSVSLSVDGTAMNAMLAGLASDGAQPSSNDAVLKATALALRDVPRFNARWESGTAQMMGAIHLGMAVATEHGLAVPVLRDVDRMNLKEIASHSFRLRRRTLARKLRSEDVTRCGFSVSNLGLLGAEEFVALINPPEAGILAVGAFKPTPMALDGTVVIRPIARLTVTGDHRIVDGADAAAFLVAIKKRLESAALD